MTTRYAEQPHWFAASSFGQFMASNAGRAVRIAAGLALIVAAYFWSDIPGYVVAGIGLVLLLAGAFDKCVLSWLFGGPFDGPTIRALGRR